MLSKVNVTAPAKLNLTLDITGLRSDGYHIMRMVMQSVDLCDEVITTRTGSGKIELSCDFPALACDENNLAARAAKAFFAYTGQKNPGISIHIKKRIPIQKGLAGGSADAAAVLVGLSRLMEAGLTPAQLCEIGLGLGADVPFCIMGGTSLAEGIGELLSPLPAMPPCHIVIAAPEGGMCTAKSFALYDQHGARRAPDTDAMVSALRNGSIEQVSANLCNVLEEVCPSLDIAPLIDIMRSQGALGAVMSGSGTAVFGIFTDSAKALSCAKALHPHTGSVHISRPCSYGARVTHEE